MDDALEYWHSGERGLFRPSQMADFSIRASRQPTLVAIDSLRFDQSPRQGGIDPGHVAALTETPNELPPILVQRSTCQVIDGVHRVNAAVKRGDQEICAYFVDCDELAAFVVAVASNVRHGLPLTLADRRAAATKILAIYPNASNRWIADVTGLSDKTIGTIRGAAGMSGRGSNSRVGRDGRTRPLSASAGRLKAEEFLNRNPGASLRAIAEYSNISLGTARDVRRRLAQGSSPVPKREESIKGAQNSTAHSAVIDAGLAVDRQAIIQKLLRDPSIRYNDSGRTLIRWLDSPRVIQNSDWEPILDEIPDRWAAEVIYIARSCAAAWEALAEELGRRSFRVTRDGVASE